MKLIHFLSLLFVVSSIVFSCKKDSESNFETDFDAIPEDKYSSTDIFENENSEIYGRWTAVQNVQSGIAGNIISIPNFDKLLIKPNAIFGVIRNDSLITSGEVVDVENTNNLFQIQLETTDDIDLLDVRILKFNTLNTLIRNDSLRLSYSNASTLLIRDN